MLTTSPDADDTPFFSLGIESRRAVVAAVSGGGDSLAMLAMLRGYIARRGLPTRLVAVTVDHGLRPESAAEARHVAGVCEAWDIDHVIRRWDGDKPSTGIAEAARNARYRLLAEAADAVVTDLIFTGHTRDDQAETFVMRSARGEGRGQAAMDRATLYDRRSWIVRPLLARGRAELRQWLTARGIGWIDDPSNERLEAERIRVRRSLEADPAALGSAIERADIARRERTDAGAAAASVFGSSAMVSPGLVHVPGVVLEGHDTEAVRHALAILVATLGGRAHLAGDVSGLPPVGVSGASPVRMTVSRCVVDRRKAGLYIHREWRGLPAPSKITGESVWDARFRIRTGDDGCHVAPVGRARAEALVQEAGDTPRSLALSALAAEPHLSRDAEGFLTFPPGDASPTVERIVAPWALFLPQSDIPAHNAVAALIGALIVPDGPSAGHIDAGA